MFNRIFDTAAGLLLLLLLCGWSQPRTEAGGVDACWVRRAQSDIHGANDIGDKGEGGNLTLNGMLMRVLLQSKRQGNLFYCSRD